MQNVTKTEKKFGVDKKRVREWNYNVLVDANHGLGKKKRKLHEGGAIFCSAVDSEVFSFFGS